MAKTARARWSAVIIPMFLFLCARRASAAEPDQAARSIIRPQSDGKGTGAPFSLTLSGGISLGAYEAGLNWVLLEWLKTKQVEAAPTGPLLGVSGASAGAVNALISAMRWCERERTTSIDNNLFSTSWRAVGLDDPQGLLPETTKNYVDVASKDPDWDPDFLISRKNAFAGIIQPVEQALSKPIFSPGCRVRLSLMVTKVRPRLIAVEGLSTRSQRLVVPLVAAVDEHGFLHFELNHELLNDDRQRNLLGEVLFLAPTSAERDARIASKDVLRAVLASSAHPSSFGPVLLKHCTRRVDCPANQQLASETPKCGGIEEILDDDGERARDLVMCAEPFVDGGAFDNVPLGLAMAQAESAAFPSANSSSLPVHYIYLDPGVRRFAGEQKCETPAPGSKKSTGGGAVAAVSPPTRDPITELVHFAGGMFNSASEYELHNVLRFNKWNLTPVRIVAKLRGLTGCAATGNRPASCSAIDPSLSDLDLKAATLNDVEAKGDATAWLAAFSQFLSSVDSLLTSVEPHDRSDGARHAAWAHMVHDVADLRQQPSAGRVLQIPTRFPPITGALLAHFAAFFDRPFRDYDYYAGLYDGIVAVADWNCEACTWPKRQQEIRRWMSQLGLTSSDGAAKALADELLTQEDRFRQQKEPPPVCARDKTPPSDATKLAGLSSTIEKVRGALEEPSRCGYTAGSCLQDVNFKRLLQNLSIAKYQAASPIASRAVEHPDDWWTEPAIRAVGRLEHVNENETQDDDVKTGVGVVTTLASIVTQHWYNLGHDTWPFRPLSNASDPVWRLVSPSVAIATTTERYLQVGFLNYALGGRNLVLAGEGSFRLGVSSDGTRPRFSSFDGAAGPTAVFNSWWFSSVNLRAGRAFFSPWGGVPRPVSYEAGFGFLLNHLRLSAGIDSAGATPHWDHKYLKLTIADLAGLMEALF